MPSYVITCADVHDHLYMSTYDGGRRTYAGEDTAVAMTAVAIMQAAYGEICSMSMGSGDCSSQYACVRSALETQPALPPPPPPPPPPSLPSPPPSFAYAPISKLCRPSTDGYEKWQKPAQPAQSASECRAACDADARCQAFEFERVSFEPGETECELHDTISIDASRATGECSEVDEVNKWRCCRLKLHPPSVPAPSPAPPPPGGSSSDTSRAAIAASSAVAGLLLVLVVGGVWYRAKKHEARSKSLPLEACEVAPAELVIASTPKSVELVETS